MAGRQKKPEDEQLRNRGIRFPDLQWDVVQEKAGAAGISAHELVRQLVWEGLMNREIFLEYRSFSKAFEITNAASKDLYTAGSIHAKIQERIRIARETRAARSRGENGSRKAND